MANVTICTQILYLFCDSYILVAIAGFAISILDLAIPADLISVDQAKHVCSLQTSRASYAEIPFDVQILTIDPFCLQKQYLAGSLYSLRT